MAVREILLLGHPTLRSRCTLVRDLRSDESRQTATDLADTLARFRRERGFGRGIAAPQIGISKRIIFIDYEIHGPLFNPRIVRRSRRTFRMWDDCFSFPDLMVRVERSAGVTVAYQDAEGARHMLDVRGGMAELLQHEIDHVEGILAVDRAIDNRHIILRSEFERQFRDSRNVM